MLHRVEREGRVEHPWNSCGCGVERHLPIQLIAPPLSVLLGSELQEGNREISEKSHMTVTSEAKEENTSGERGQGTDRRKESVGLPSQRPGTWEISLGNAVWTSPCASELGVGRPGV